MGNLFNEVLYKPIFNSLVWLYNNAAFGDLGVAIILATVLTRIIFFPLFQKSLKHQRLVQELQPRIKKIQEDHKNDREKQTKAIMDLYGSSKVNPLMPFLLLIVQLPILFALYQVFVTGLNPDSFRSLYSFIPEPQSVNHSFLGFMDLRHPNIIITLLATIATYFQGKLALPKTKAGKGEVADKMSRQMVFLAPGITLIFLFNFPSAVGLYWLTTTTFSIIQQIIVNRGFENEGIAKTS
ncbi:MAG: membrane protein insertase YidC [Candidatus Colwellbacteria bacterium]|nr:membrane protein insertase YidC [Candidatus Colwellbacteria bacterium]